MNKLHNEFNQDAYEYTTESGLHVMLVHRPGFKRSVAVYGTPFGALDLQQVSEGVLTQHKTGVAHFLEHKLFEDETEDVFSKFAACGASANAFTSYEQTMYYFTTNGDVETPLGILIDFVSRFKLDQERVDKEKGIILEELRMYAKMPDSNLLSKTYQNTLHTYPYIHDIGGTEEDVSAMLLEDLETAYRLNYADSVMGLVVVSGTPIEMLKRVVDAHTASHQLVAPHTKTVFEEEALTVPKANDVIYDAVQTPKMSLTFKFAFTDADLMFNEYMIRMILELNFGELNPEYQTWLDEGIVNDAFGYDVDLRDGFGIIYFFNEGEDFTRFESTIREKMATLTVDEHAFELLSKRHYGQVIMSLERTDRFAINLLQTHFKGTNYFNYLQRIRNIDIDSVNTVLLGLKEFNTSFTIMKPNP